MINQLLKRTFDLFFSLLGIILLSPLYLFIALSIKRNSPGPILFRQTRVGRNRWPFKILKFRTMVVDAGQRGGQLTIGGRDGRITQVGYILRKFKLDELPQLYNVLVGDMSFVGPRPEVPKYVELYDQEQLKVLEVKPGITDLASIEFRNENELLEKYDNPDKAYIEEIMPQKLKLNLVYINSQSLFLDVLIILKTILKIIN